MAKTIHLMLEIIVMTELNVFVDSVAPKELRLLAQLPLSGGNIHDNRHARLCNITIQKALEDINAFPDLLEGYNLVYDYVDTKSCFELSDSTKREVTEKLAFPYILIGGTCKYITEEILEHVSSTSVQIAYLASSSNMADRWRFPKLYRLTAPERVVSALVQLLVTFKWNRIAIIHEDFQSPNLNDLMKEFNVTNVDVIATRIYTYFEKPELEHLKFMKNARIIVVTADEYGAAQIMCNAYKLNMYGKWFVWIFLKDLSSISFWHFETRCSRKDLVNAFEGAFFLNTVDHDPLDKTGIANITYSDLIADISYRANTNVTKEDTFLDYAHGKCYDHVWVAALALNCSLNSLDALYGEPKPKQAKRRNMITDCMDTLDFKGTSGRIRFEDGAVNPLFVLERIQDSYRKVVAYFRKDDHPNSRYKWIEGALIWKDKIIPVDSGLTSDTEKPLLYFTTSLYLTICVLAGVGIIVTIACLVFNFVWRNNRIVKMSSPNINNIILAGCLVLYTTIVIETTATATKTMCAVKLFCFWIGFATTFGSMLSKTWRVYKIFTNKKMRQNMNLRDTHLLGIIGIVVTMETIVLTVWASYSPHVVTRHQLGKENGTIDNGDRMEMTVFYLVCESEDSYYFIWTLRIMNGVLMAFGAFLAWETRQVHIEALNDSKTIGICVYNVVILSAVGLLLSQLLKDKPIELHGVASLCLFAGTLVSKMLIFLPKMLAVYRSPNATPQTALNLEPLISSDKATQTIHSPELDNTNDKD